MEEINPSKSNEEINVPAQKKERKKIKLLPIFVFLLILSLVGNVFLFLSINNLKISGNYISGEFLRFVKPLDTQPIDSNIEETNSILQYENLKPIILKEMEKYNEGRVGVYLQDAKTGTWMGIYERDGFAPASLLKIPVMMAILKKIDLGEISSKDTITLIPEDIDYGYGTLYMRGAGAKITVSELLSEMILSSDNTAGNALQRQLSLGEIDSVFVHIGIPDPYIISNNQTVSPRDYTRFFKSLYFSTFLSPKLSNMALELTTDTQEENLISKKIPPEIQVAHKFGVHNSDSYKSLHDCGIVYHPKNPYFLCIMTKNLEKEKSKELISEISKDVYDYINEK